MQTNKQLEKRMSPPLGNGVDSMKRMIVRNVQNAVTIPLVELPYMQEITIKRIWTILNEEKLFQGVNSQTGEGRILNLEEVVPQHGETAFMEERNHDWIITPDAFRYFSRIVKAQDCADLLIEYE